jgi:hypothetical protein
MPSCRAEEIAMARMAMLMMVGLQFDAGIIAQS